MYNSVKLLQEVLPSTAPGSELYHGGMAAFSLWTDAGTEHMLCIPDTDMGHAQNTLKYLTGGKWPTLSGMFEQLYLELAEVISIFYWLPAVGE